MLSVFLPAMETRKYLRIMACETVKLYLDTKQNLLILSGDNYFFRFSVGLPEDLVQKSFMIKVQSEDIINICTMVRSRNSLIELSIEMDEVQSIAKIKLVCEYKDEKRVKEVESNIYAYTPNKSQVEEISLTNQFSKMITLAKDCKSNEFMPISQVGEIYKSNNVCIFSVLGINESYLYLIQDSYFIKAINDGIYEFDLCDIKCINNFMNEVIVKHPFSIRFNKNSCIISYDQMSYSIKLNKVQRNKCSNALFKKQLTSQFVSCSKERIAEKCGVVPYLDRKIKMLPDTFTESDRFCYLREEDKANHSLLQVIFMKSRQ